VTHPAQLVGIARHDPRAFGNTFRICGSKPCNLIPNNPLPFLSNSPTATRNCDEKLGFDYEISAKIGYPDDRNGSSKITEDRRNAVAADEAALRIKPDDLRTLHAYAVDLSEIGDSREPTDPEAALAYYQRELEIERNLSQSSTELRYACGLAIAYGEIAGVYGDIGDYPRLVENNRKGLAIYEELKRADPKNALLRQGLAIAFANTATALAKVGSTGLGLEDWNKGVGIMRNFVSSAPQNARQRDILAAIVAAGGLIFMHAHKPEAAQKQFEEARAIYQSLQTAVRPINLPTWQLGAKNGRGICPRWQCSVGC
jgi:tetratricopeptide (TPR) repeat protein